MSIVRLLARVWGASFVDVGSHQRRLLLRTMAAGREHFARIGSGYTSLWCDCALG
jgi:hypothetical protein